MFSIEEYKKNPSRKIVTRDRKKVRIACIDNLDEKYPVIGFIDGHVGAFTWRGDGIYGSTKEYDKYDLFFADEVDELKESENKRIRVKLINALKECGFTHFNEEFTVQEALDWLEKQKSIDEEIVFRPLAGCDIDKAAKQALEKTEIGKKVVLAFNGAYIPVNEKTVGEIESEYDAWLEKQGEKKPTIIIPKFRVGDKIRRKNPCLYDRDIQVARVESDYYICNHLGKFSSESVSFSEESNYELVEQKPADKDEPKFKVGDWIVFNNQPERGSIYQVEKIENFQYTLRHFLGGSMHLSFSHEDMIRFWTIQDAKDGDVLVNGEMVVIFKHFEEPSYRQHIVASLVLDTCGTIQITNECWSLGVDKAKPATKEQRDLLFQKMKEAGYEWDAEKKELKKIEQEQTELLNDEDYGIDSLYHAARILEKTLGEVDGYQSDDGILEHKCAIEAVNRLYKQKHTEWSEEDEKTYNEIIDFFLGDIESRCASLDKQKHWGYWLKSIKDKVRPKQEWSKDNADDCWDETSSDKDFLNWSKRR